MSIRYDPPVARALARSLQERLEGARVRAVWFQYDHGEARLYTDEGLLVVGLAAGNAPPDLRLLPPEDPPEEARRIPLRVHSVEAVPDERIIAVRMHRIRGSSGTHALVVEFRPGDANVAFTEDEDDIVRHLLVPRESRGRHWRSGHPYPFPAPSERAGRTVPDELEAIVLRALAPTTAERFRTALELADALSFWLVGAQESRGRHWRRGHPYPFPGPSERAGADGELDAGAWAAATAGDDPRRALLSGVAHTSSLNADWLLEPGTPEERRRRWLELASAGDEVVLLPEGQPYPHPLGHADAEPVDLLEFLTVGPERDEGAVRRDLLRRLEEQATRAGKRAEAIGRQLEDAADPDQIRARADLLLSRLREVPSGVDQVELVDFQGEPTTLELNPELSPQENAEALYDEAGRAERAREKLPGLIAEAREAEERWAELLERFRSGEIGAEEVEEQLPDSRDGGSTREGPSYPYRRFRSSGGIEIRVGRGARRNDDLTFHHSRPDDVWMHARHAAGAHVVLRWAREEAPPARDLHEAATLAALHSKARTSGSVPVDWTRRKYVRKPKGAAPGAVLMDRQETVFVEPDPEVSERLAVDDD